MTEKPIIFNGEMVRAILSGQKTQTRRPVKPQPNNLQEFRGWVRSGALSKDSVVFAEGESSPLKNILSILCNWKVGDRLWVRETWAHYQTINHRVCRDGRSFSEVSDGLAAYRADGHESIRDMKDHIRLMSESDFEGVEVRDDKWIPSIHMPRWVSRITLEITYIRIERLNEISEEDAKAEGVTAGICPGYENIMHRVAFRELWESIYGPGSFDDKWVWVIEFKRMEAL
ncbi:hypothetical protein GPY51_10935 [Photorhabdus laumondii subsp. laumondii]|uniref:Morphogenetic protein n=1 Tax=Photorhabdus laumondii subsp. laumondii TaxID=141679 RepID=A0A6L9JJJ3_PHOLM|nr:hypothetical protein [Photorhabdus laumondii]MCC8384609.1 hypothetical protein [Photorhabdus laumondii]MCC8413345.1 hypothetical protein [Photorhabdus laumondii]NDK95010.1 hypothetical protein [Photorhabdus laumondii subsp. laumondii]NDL21302.1 hypothetical protein [Photorhabdus laumondii subsp. laumondii]NDL30201.1 hypothetical protein [Photorhabdus laumondii subsp. laumondii]